MPLTDRSAYVMLTRLEEAAEQGKPLIKIYGRGSLMISRSNDGLAYEWGGFFVDKQTALSVVKTYEG